MDAVHLIFCAKKSLGRPQGFSNRWHFCGISHARHYWDMSKGKVQNWHLCNHRCNNQKWQDLTWLFLLTGCEKQCRTVSDFYFRLLSFQVCALHGSVLSSDGQFSLRLFFKTKALNLQPNMGNSCRDSCYFLNKKSAPHFAGVLERFASLKQFHMSLTSLYDYIATMENFYFPVFWGVAIPSVTFHSSSLRIWVIW